MEAVRYEEFYTIEDYDRWEGRWELIEGRPYAMSPAPLIGHQRVSLQLAKLLDEGACEGCLALQDIDYVVSEETVVRPDVLLICDVEEERLTKTPKMVFEIVSPSTARRDETIKFSIYEREGVAYYGLVYPSLRVVKLYRRNALGRFEKVGDFSKESVTLEEERCTMMLDFGKIWP